MFTKMREKMFKMRKGFTLVELIIVLAILGILASIAVPTFAGIQARSTIKAEVATAQSIIHEARTLQADSKGGIVKMDIDDVPSAKAHPNFVLSGGGDDAKYVVTWTSAGGSTELAKLEADYPGLAVDDDECVLTEQ